mmetsp:Transcript_113468/g.327689  ORF Transcript_113468/g.327689 Transcript_113468/m.327689 type:complete len:451 (-) Transcript_113468:46-1398(-)
MGAACCAEREGRTSGTQPAKEQWLRKTPREVAGVWVAPCGLRGCLVLAERTFQDGDVIHEELPMALVFPHRDPGWMAAARTELEAHNATRAWQFCLAAHCLAAADLPACPPEGLTPLSNEEAAKVMKLSRDDAATTAESLSLAWILTRHMIQAVRETSGQAVDIEESVLAKRLDYIAARISRHAFQVQDTTMSPPVRVDALFYQASFVNSCMAGSHTTNWAFDPTRKTLKVTAIRTVIAGEELTFDAKSRPWIASGTKPSSQCVCTACRHLARGARRAQPAGKETAGIVDDTHFATPTTTPVCTPRGVGTPRSFCGTPRCGTPRSFSGTPRASPRSLTPRVSTPRTVTPGRSKTREMEAPKDILKTAAVAAAAAALPGDVQLPHEECVGSDVGGRSDDFLASCDTEASTAAGGGGEADVVLSTSIAATDVAKKLGGDEAPSSAERAAAAA